MKFDLKHLEAFIWVADLGSFRKAAQRLNTTQPNISVRISRLESVLNTTLMARDAGSVRLTSKGRELLDYAREVVRAAESLIEAADAPALFDGTLRLGVAEMVVNTWLHDFLKTLKLRYPKIMVELTVDLSVNLERELAERSIDLAFQSGPFLQQFSVNRELGTYSLIWVAAPDIGLHEASQITVGMLAEHSILTHARDTKPYEETAAHFARRKMSSVRLVPSSNLNACLQMTIDGLGVATLPKAMVLSDLRSGKLREVEYEWTPNDLEFFARYDLQSSSHIVVAAAEIAQEVAEQFE